MFSSLCNSEFGVSNTNMIDHEHVRYEKNHQTRGIRSMKNSYIKIHACTCNNSQVIFWHYSQYDISEINSTEIFSEMTKFL